MSSKARLSIAILLALLAMVPFLAAGGLHTFIAFDDDAFVTENPVVRGGLSLSGVLWAFSTFRVASWHPLTWIAHMTVVSLFGLDPFWHHLVNVTLHAAGAALLFTALHRMTGAAGRSALVAALFAVHPLHVESVAWVSELKDVLSGLLFSAVLLAYERFARRGGAGRYLLVLALLALGLLAKQMLVTVPVVLLLCDVWPLGRARLWFAAAPERTGAASWGRLLAEKAPLLMLSGAASLGTLASGSAGDSLTPLSDLPLANRVANALVACAAYLWKALWPRDLAVFYPQQASPPPWEVVSAVVLLSGMTALAVHRFRRSPFALIGWSWFLVMLAPVAGFVRFGTHGVADRYTYLPLTGIFIAVIWGAADACRRRGIPALPLGIAAAAAVAALAAQSTHQMRFWRDSETLFTRTLAVTTGNWFIHNNLGVHYEQAGRLDEAEAHFREALRINPSFARAFSNLGSIQLRKGRPEEALVLFREAVRIDSREARAHYNLAVLLAGSGRLAEAESHYREALRLRPDHAEAHTNLAIALERLGRPAEAEAHHRESVRLRPDLADSRAWFGTFLAASGRFEAAAAEYQQALRLRPDDAETRFRLGAVRVAQGRLEEAAREFAETLRIDPGHEGVRQALAVVPGLRERLARPHSAE